VAAIPSTSLPAQPSPTTQLGPGFVAAVTALTLMGPFASDAVLPALPMIAAEFETTADRAQLTITGATFGVAIGQLILGTLSDAWGRRRLLLAGGIGLVVAAALAAVAPSIELLIAASALLGIAGAAGLALGRAVLADRFSGGVLNRAYSLWGAAIGVAPMAAAFGGALLLSAAGWRSIFWVLAFLGAVTLLLTVMWMPETHPAERRARASWRAFGAGIAEVLRSREFLSGALVTWFGFAAVFAYISASPFILQSMLGFTPVAFSLVLVADGVGLIITGAIAARLATAISPHWLIAMGLAIATVGAVVAVFAVAMDAVNPWTMVASMVLIGASMGFVFGSATTLAVSGRPQLTGTALALMGSVQFIFAGIAAPLVGIAGEDSVVPFAVVATVAIGCAWFGLSLAGGWRAGGRR